MKVLNIFNDNWNMPKQIAQGNEVECLMVLEAVKDTLTMGIGGSLLKEAVGEAIILHNDETYVLLIEDEEVLINDRIGEYTVTGGDPIKQ